MSEKPSDEENAEEGYFSFEGGLEHDGDEPQLEIDQNENLEEVRIYRGENKSFDQLIGDEVEEEEVEEEEEEEEKEEKEEKEQKEQKEQKEENEENEENEEKEHKEHQEQKEQKG